MSEAVSFWMDNKNCVGKIAVINGDQSLVIYRDRYYVLKDGTAQAKGGKPLRYSLSSLPTLWKRALKGSIQPSENPVQASESSPVPEKPERSRKKREKPVMQEPQAEAILQKNNDLPAKAPKLV